MGTSEPRVYCSGDILVVPFPYSDRQAEKRRPALVLSNERLAQLGYVWIAMITTSRRQGLPGDIVLTADSQTGLPQPSIVRTAKIACIEPDRVIRKLGKVSEAERQAALGQVRAFLE